MTTPIKRALISVSNKTGIVEFAKALIGMNIDIISTGGTSKLLQDANIPHRQVEEITGSPEMLDGRVKTLHPKIHGGILGKRDKHELEMTKHGLRWIDLVVVNFYPFADAIKNNDLTWDKAVEHIDIGGPTMVRAAAKNFAWVGVIVDPADYAEVITALTEENGLDFSLRQKLAQKAFATTSAYDEMISTYFKSKMLSSQATQTFPNNLDLHLEKKVELRYGENPHQQACAYQFKNEHTGILSAKQLQGKPLSYNNILDAEAALTGVSEFTEPACVIIKHANPCGVACAATIEVAYQRAYQADALSAFGGIVALNRECTADIANAISGIFMEVIVAPSYTDEALAIFASKPNLRVLIMPAVSDQTTEMRFIAGGLLLQERDRQIVTLQDLKVVTRVQPNANEMETMLFAWRVLKHIKSNGILLAKDNATVGIGAGQVSRIDSVDIAVRKAGENIKGCVLASDAFFPFRDSIDRLAGSGIGAIIQPGGSMRDGEVIAACDEQGIAMVFTGTRCFRH